MIYVIMSLTVFKCHVVFLRIKVYKASNIAFILVAYHGQLLYLTRSRKYMQNLLCDQLPYY